MLLPLVVFLAVAAFVFAVSWLFVRSGKADRNQVFSGGRRRPLIFGSLTGALAGVIPCTATSREEMTKDLRRAGFYQRFAFEEFAALRNSLIVGWVFLIGSIAVVASGPGSDDPTPAILIVGAVGSILFFSLPRMILRSKASARLQEIQFGLPDAIDMITMCMSGGLALEHAVTRVSDELVQTHPALACELRIIGRQTAAGSLDGAMRQFADRIDIPDAQSLAAMACQTAQQGNNVANAFEDFSDGVRRGRRQRAEERGNKASIKLLFPLVFCLAPPVYMLLLVPAAMELKSFVLRENGPGGVLSAANEGSTENGAVSGLSDLSSPGTAREGAVSLWTPTTTDRQPKGADQASR